jgi:hypothetical protein
MSFDELAVDRDTIGRFSEKRGSRPEISLAEFDAEHPEIAGLGARIVEPTPELNPSQGRDENGKRTWSVDGPDGLTLIARRSGFRNFEVSYGEEPKKWSWRGRKPEEALAAAYAGMQTDEVRENRIESFGHSASEMASTIRDTADLSFKMGHITASERDTATVTRW